MTLAPWATEPALDVEAILDAAEGSAEPVHQPWSIQSPGDAEWAMGRLSDAEAELAAIDAQRAEWQAQLDAWHRAVVRRPLGKKLLFAGWLTDYARRRRDATSRATLTLPGGRVTSRNNPAKLVVTNADAVLAWARHNATEVIKEVVRLDALRSAVSVRDGRPVSRDGEVVAGLDVEPAFVSYSVKIGR